MIFSPHHTTPPLTQVEPGTWAWPIWIWYSRLSFISIFFFFSFSCSFAFSRSDWALFVFLLFFCKGKLTTHDLFLHYCLSRSPELENRLTRFWQRETHLEKETRFLARTCCIVYEVEEGQRCDAMRFCRARIFRSTQIPNPQIVSLQIGTICDLHPGS